MRWLLIAVAVGLAGCGGVEGENPNGETGQGLEFSGTWSGEWRTRFGSGTTTLAISQEGEIEGVAAPDAGGSSSVLTGSVTPDGTINLACLPERNPQGTCLLWSLAELSEMVGQAEMVIGKLRLAVGTDASNPSITFDLDPVEGR